MKTAAASVISASASAPPIWNSRRKTSDVLRKLSLNAAKNWVQNRGAKRRVISREEDMAFPLVPTRYGGARARAAPTGADGLRDNNLGKTTNAAAGGQNADIGARQTPIMHKTKAGGPGPPPPHALPP